MSTQGGTIGENSFVAHYTIMSNMAISHNPIVIPNARDSATLHGTPIESTIFADFIAISYGPIQVPAAICTSAPMME
jgi:hypothetical protein